MGGVIWLEKEARERGRRETGGREEGRKGRTNRFYLWGDQAFEIKEGPPPPPPPPPSRTLWKILGQTRTVHHVRVCVDADSTSVHIVFLYF